MVVGLFACTLVGVLPSYELLGRWINDGVSGERYPCKGGACGCSSARECWTVCRCQSLEQKVAWAVRERVAVPGYVDLRGVDFARIGEGEMGPGCPLCAAKEMKSAARPAVLDGESCGGGAPEEDVIAGARDGLPTLSPMGCRGIELLMAVGVVLVVGVDPMVGVLGADCIGRVWVDPATSGDVWVIGVEPPPPRA